ncbi:hypothetical protein JMJ35_008171 [Cladonia borealis]|uniref:Uncharacterized protein n=1 Tax=Cladonia borealis TaxID=184061 RepID=A0AA39QV27_9LECA|nr:hypothetical protein JMJ35_008171 [Cladonia borealis]
MSSPNIDPAHSNLASPTDPKTSQIDANLRLATEKAQPIRLRRMLQELRYTQPDAHKVTGAFDEDEEDEEEEGEEDEDFEDESESDGSSDAVEISELSSEEEEDDEDSNNDSDDDMKRSELGSGEEDDGTDEEGASTTTSTRHMPVKSELRRNG